MVVANKDTGYFTYKSNRTVENRSVYVKARNLFNAILECAKFHYGQKIKDKLLNTYHDARSFWSFANDVSDNFMKSSTPPLIDCDGNPIIQSKSKANAFVKIFAESSSLAVTNQRPPIIPPARCRMKLIRFWRRVISRVVRSLNTNKFTGPDGIPPTVLKNCNWNWNWKLTNVQPVFKKKGNRLDPKDYYPIVK